MCNLLGVGNNTSNIERDDNSPLHISLDLISNIRKCRNKGINVFEFYILQFQLLYFKVVNQNGTKGKKSFEKKRLSRIESIINGKVEYDANRDEFYLKKGNTRQEFTLVAEGIRKMALLWQLVKNGTLEKGSVLFWDEPEANINPKYISVIAELLLELQRNGVQIFVATHDYMLSKYFEVRKNKGDSIMFFSIEKKDTEVVTLSSCDYFGEINSEITKSFEELLDEIYDKSGFYY